MIGKFAGRQTCTLFMVWLVGCTGGETAVSITSTPAFQSTPTIEIAELETAETTANECIIQQEGDMQYLALGDSYTIGESVSEAERWPVQLATRLRQNGVALANPTIIARTGWTTGELWAGIEQANPQGPYDLVSLLIGVNNQYRGYDQEEYRQEFVALLEQAIGFAGGNAGRVFVLSIPDWGVTPFAVGRDTAQIAAEIDAFNVINREESARLNVAYVDIIPISREAINDPSLIANDGLHPSGKMYARWVELVLPVVCKLLGN